MINGWSFKHFPYIGFGGFCADSMETVDNKPQRLSVYVWNGAFAMWNVNE